MRWIRLVCIVYWIALTVLLLAPHPVELLGLTRAKPLLPTVWHHWATFAVLALLCFASRPRCSAAALILVLVLYGTATEAAQWFLPPRTVDARDYAEDLLGIATGAALWFGGAALRPRPQAPRDSV